MNKRNAILRGACFAILYLLLYIAPTVTMCSGFARHLPPLIGNWCLSFPQLMFPFNILFWKYHKLDDHTAFFVSAFYLILLAWFFSFLTRSIQKFQWLTLAAFCFSIISVVAMTLIFWAAGIFEISIEPQMP
jgi:hypothetical protein